MPETPERMMTISSAPGPMQHQKNTRCSALKIGDIVKDEGSPIRLVVVGASDKGYDLYSVWPFNDRFHCWEVDADGHGDILSIVPDPEWDAMKITNIQKK